MIHKILAGLLWLTTIQSVFSQTLDKDKLNRYFDTLESNDKYMGTVLLYQNDKKIYTHTTGYSNIAARTKVSENTSYRVGSISKTFTAALVLKAVEEGRIRLNQTIETFFPSIPNANRITIRELLNHHSGIGNFTGGAGFLKWHTQPKTEKEMIEIIAHAGSDFAPGSHAQYSNSNYVLLSYILEHIYKNPYGAILSEKIVQPLGLKHTQFGDKANAAKTYSYTYEVGWNKVDETDLSIPMGAGGIVLAAPDLAVFIDALFNGKIVSDEMLTQMEDQTDGYGMGLFRVSFDGKTGYRHDGKIDGYNSVFYYFPKEHITCVLLSNAENYDPDHISTTVLKAVFNKPFEIPTFNAYQLTADDLVPYLGTYTSEETSLIITVSRKGNVMLAQPKGQQIFTMEAVDKDRFKHELSGVTLRFIPSKKQMIMKQGKQTFLFTKE